MNAWLYECQVMHERLVPRHHRFTYRTAYLCLGPGAWEGANRALRLLSLNRSNLVSLWERDFLPTGEPIHNPGDGAAAPGGQATLAQRVGALCRAGGADPGEDPRVLLVAMPRVLGYGFNPVSFHYCLRADGSPAGAVAEVTNTFREVKPYFVPASADGTFRARAVKHFYVSPFSPADLAFDFTLPLPGDTLEARIDTLGPEGVVVRTRLGGRRRPLTDRALAGLLLRHPLLPLAVMARIHLQAARLWWRNVPHFRKAASPGDQRDLYRPHASLRSGAEP